jgi:hypothetical protein
MSWHISKLLRLHILSFLIFDSASKAGLHYGDCRSKLVHFKAQKIFSISKN